MSVVSSLEGWSAMRAFAASLFTQDSAPSQAELVAILIEEANVAANLSDMLHQVARGILGRSSRRKPSRW